MRAVASVTLIVLVGKALGLVREMMFAAYLGGGALADAFSFASLMPRVLLDAMFAAAISASFIPIFNTQLQLHGRDTAFKLANRFLNVMLILSGLVTAAAWVLAPWLVGVGAAGFSSEYAALTVSLLRTMLPLLVFSSAAFSLAGVLQSFGRFSPPAMMSVAANVLVIAFYVFLFDDFGVNGLAVAFLAGWCLQLVILLPSLWRCGFRYSPILRIDPALRQVAVLVAPAMVFAWVLPLNLQVNIFSVSHIVGGSTALNLSNTVYTIVTGVFVLSLTNVIFPRLSREAAGSPQAFAKTLRGCLKGLLYLLVPLGVALHAMAPFVVRILFERGEFDIQASRLTMEALAWLSLGMAGFGAQTLLSRAYFALKDGRTPLYSAIIAVSINALISFGLSPMLGVRAAAIASTTAMTICALFLFVRIWRMHPQVWDGCANRDIFKVVAASAIMFCVLAVGGGMVPQTGPGAVLVVPLGLLAVVVYVLFTYAMGTSEARVVVSYIRTRTKI